MQSLNNLHTTFLSLSDFERKETIESSMNFPYTDDIQSCIGFSLKMGTCIEYQSLQDLIDTFEEIGRNEIHRRSGGANILQDVIGLLLSEQNDFIDLEELDTFCIKRGKHTLLCLRNSRENRMYPGISGVLELNDWGRTVHHYPKTFLHWNFIRDVSLVSTAMLTIVLLYSAIFE
jgi:hypothetical protein